MAIRKLSSRSAREQFIGNIAHQIRTPLAGIKLQAQLASDEPDLAAMQGAMQKIARAADSMTHVNSQLMKLARAEAASGRGLRREPVDLAAVARHCCVALDALANEKHITLSLQAPDSLDGVEGERTLLTEMMSNLIENAIIYMQESGHVWASVVPTQNGIEFSVEDDGPGIDEAHWPQLFERFFRSAPEVGEGCGLGLAIVREIAMAHGASVELEAGRDNRGARFCVRFAV